VLYVEVQRVVVQSVVSGQCQPDEIKIRRTWDDQLSVEQKTIGDKKLRTALSCV